MVTHLERCTKRITSPFLTTTMSPQKQPVSYSNILLGACLNMFEVTTLGQPLEVTKTHMAANRGDGLINSFRNIWARGGILGFYQGLLPWAWIEASTKGAVLLFTASELEHTAKVAGSSNFVAGILGGMGGGIAQAYATMGFCTCMKTVEITRLKVAAGGQKPPGTFQVFMDIYRREGIKGINKGVNAVAIRQCTNWGSRIGLSRLAESCIRDIRGLKQDSSLTPLDKICASVLGGGLSAWNQPIEVIRVEMQSAKNDPNRPQKLSIVTTAKYIYANNGFKGLYRGVTPRICLGVWQTVCMVGVGDIAKVWVAKITGETPVGKH
ncbi:Citrate/oxoglutarate carrier protein [Neolecta irregularis DAH-3]|uniref:Citrate/oxoglutarate carrier protein n=1 Tax=Neolecta irregularis (strain DAH-3) TaxID=1198029 RepID=A0A1U7LQM6_NEOID|nr:Citrate/oxoglutarate carrier protein [Neolecta irregularis DAH-3]|eukprot:OLL24852.1 Citrate/oxoglutarate carrier protein [Neolecta irregularis DAH-3]